MLVCVWGGRRGEGAFGCEVSRRVFCARVTGGLDICAGMIRNFTAAGNISRYYFRAADVFYGEGWGVWRGVSGQHG